MSADLLLDSYAAKTCTYALRLRHRENPLLQLDPSPVAVRRMEMGNDFEHLVGERLARIVAPVDLARFDVDGMREADESIWATRREARLQATVEAMHRGVRFIWNPRLPADRTCHRSGEPDLLVRIATIKGRARYLPVDVKAHHLFAPMLRSQAMPLASICTESPADGELIDASWCAHPEDLLQLAHYWRMLQACDRAPDGAARGAIIGSPTCSDVASMAWFDLESVMDDYELAFAEALAVVERALSDEPDPELHDQPWYTKACQECSWRAVCAPRLIEQRSVSLARPNRRIWSELDELGINTIEDLAEIDTNAIRPTGTPISHSKYWRESIRRAQYAAGGDILPLARFATTADASCTPILWRRADLDDDAPWALPAGDVELDIDMECTTSHVYLWGTLLSYRDGIDADPALEPGYRGFGEGFPSPIATSERAIFVSFWDFVQSIIDSCARRGLTLRTFCYSNAERRWMRQCADRIDATAPRHQPRYRNQVERLVESASWIDLHQEIRQRVDSLGGLSLKNIAQAIGFAWRAADAGGEASMLWYECATQTEHGAQREQWRKKILDYNEDDVRATWYLRQWFAAHDRGELPRAPS